MTVSPGMEGIGGAEEVNHGVVVIRARAERAADRLDGRHDLLGRAVRGAAQEHMVGEVGQAGEVGPARRRRRNERKTLTATTLLLCTSFVMTVRRLRNRVRCGRFCARRGHGGPPRQDCQNPVTHSRPTLAIRIIRLLLPRSGWHRTLPGSPTAYRHLQRWALPLGLRAGWGRRPLLAGTVSGGWGGPPLGGALGGRAGLALRGGSMLRVSVPVAMLPLSDCLGRKTARQ